MFFYRNPLKWVKNLEISASSAWDPAGIVFGQTSDFSENQETIIAGAGIGYQDGGKLGFLVVLKKDAEGSYEQVQTIRPSGLSVYGSDTFSSTVLMSKDSSTIIAYASTETGTIEVDSPDSGAIVVFQSGSAGYVQSQILLPPTDLTSRGIFQQLEISDDGSRLFVKHSISYSRSITYNEKGKIYVYEKNVSGLFELQQTIEPPSDNSLVNFGSIYVTKFYLSQDKTSFFVSSEHVSGSFNNQGAVCFYKSGSNGYELADIIVDQDEIGDGGRFGSSISYSSQNNLLAVYKQQPDYSGAVILYQSGSNGFQKVQTIENFVDENLNSSYLTEDGTTLLTTVYKKTNNPKNKTTIRFYQSGSNGFQPTGVELETDDTYTNWDFFAFPNYRLDYDKPAGRIIATAHGHDVAGVGSQVGAIYVFDSGSSGWQQSQLITASDDWSPYADVFGSSFQLADNNEILAINQTDAQDTPWVDGGNYWQQFNADSVGGSIYIYKKQGEGYEQVQRIHNPSPGIADYFGWFTIADSGNKLAITAGGAAHSVHTGSVNDQLNEDTWLSGKVFVYESGSSGYTFVQEIKKDPPNQFFSFGTDVALNSSGQNLFISAHDTSTGGSVYVYASGSSGYTQVQELTSSFATPNSYDYFTSIELSKDGQILLVCELYGDSDTKQNIGSLTIFVSGSEGYEEVQRLTPDDTIDPDGWGIFGGANGMFISEDNQTIAIGSRYEQVQLDQSVARQGAVRIYQSGSSGYEQVQLITAPIEDPVNGNEFGIAVDISGSYLAIGSPADAHDESSGTSFSSPDRGSVWIYEKINGVYEKKYRIARESGSNTQGVGTWNGVPGFRSNFGSTVKLLPNNEILIGSPYDDKNGVDSGVVYKYKLTRDY